jgi:hypothetical protein
MSDLIPYPMIADALAGGKVVPFLGAGASAGHRPEGGTWQPGAPFGPLGHEFAAFLAAKSTFPDESARHDLMLVASYVEEVAGGEARLCDYVHEVFGASGLQPGPLHRLLARCTNTKLILTTNYDCLMEAALRATGVPPMLS